MTQVFYLFREGGFLFTKSYEVLLKGSSVGESVMPNILAKNVCGQDYTLTSRKPGLLSDVEYKKCVDSIRNLYLWFSPGSTDDAIRQRLCGHPDNYLDTIIDASGECAGFSVHRTECFAGQKVMFRGGTVVGHRSQGLYKQFLRSGVELVQPNFLTAMTQNPRVYETMRSFSPCGRAYPSPEAIPSDEVQQIAQHFCKAPGLVPTSMHVPEVYASIRKDESFKTSRDPAVAQMFATLQENDAFFVVVPL